MKIDIKKILGVLFPDGKYIPLDNPEDNPRYLGYSNAFKDAGIDCWLPHATEVADLDDCLVISIRKYFLSPGWEEEEDPNMLVGIVVGIVKTVYPKSVLSIKDITSDQVIVHFEESDD